LERDPLVQPAMKTQHGKGFTDRQNMRQQQRDKKGKYSRHHRCELCDKPAGDKHTAYYSDDRCNKFAGKGLVLCAKCATILEKVPDDQYEAQFNKKASQ